MSPDVLLLGTKLLDGAISKLARNVPDVSLMSLKMTSGMHRFRPTKASGMGHPIVLTCRFCGRLFLSQREKDKMAPRVPKTYKP